MPKRRSDEKDWAAAWTRFVEEMIHRVLFNVFFVCCLIYTMKYGGKPERAVMLSETAAVVLTIVAVYFLPHSAGFDHLPLALALIDVTLFLALASIALTANRLWTIVLGGLQLSTVFVHLSKILFPGLPAASYGVFAQFWSWPIMITTVVGAHHHKMRVRRFGPEADWKPLWPESAQA